MSLPVSLSWVTMALRLFWMDLISTFRSAISLDAGNSLGGGTSSSEGAAGSRGRTGVAGLESNTVSGAMDDFTEGGMTCPGRNFLTGSAMTSVIGWTATTVAGSLDW